MESITKLEISDEFTEEEYYNFRFLEEYGTEEERRNYNDMTDREHTNEIIGICDW